MTAKASTPLNMATVLGDLPKVVSLLESGEVQKSDSQGWTPLMLAAQCGQNDIVRVLVDNNRAELNKKLYHIDYRGYTALLLAVENGHSAVVKILLKYGAAQDCNNDGWTPLISAAYNGHDNIVKDLLENEKNRSE